jgi:hypothetical protein
MKTLGEWLRDKADTFLLLALFAFLLYRGVPEAHEAFGALLLALTGSRKPSTDA